MKLVLYFLGIALLAFAACDDEKTDSRDPNSIYGYWVDDVTDPQTVINLKKDGTGTKGDVLMGEAGREKFTFSYKDSVLIINDETSYKVKTGDVMTWTSEDAEGISSLSDIWFRDDFIFRKNVSDGRWNGSRDGSDDYECSIIFNDGNIDIYIMAWGEHLVGTYRHSIGILSVELSEGYNARIVDGDSWSWEAGNINPETFELTEGYTWVQMDSTVFNERQNSYHQFTFVVDTETQAYGGQGRNLKFVKSE